MGYTEKLRHGIARDQPEPSGTVMGAWVRPCTSGIAGPHERDGFIEVCFPVAAAEVAFHREPAVLEEEDLE